MLTQREIPTTDGCHGWHQPPVFSITSAIQPPFRHHGFRGGFVGSPVRQDVIDTEEEVTKWLRGLDGKGALDAWRRSGVSKQGGPRVKGWESLGNHLKTDASWICRVKRTNPAWTQITIPKLSLCQWKTILINFATPTPLPIFCLVRGSFGYCIQQIKYSKQFQVRCKAWRLISITVLHRETVGVGGAPVVFTRHAETKFGWHWYSPMMFWCIFE